MYKPLILLAAPMNRSLFCCSSVYLHLLSLQHSLSLFTFFDKCRFLHLLVVRDVVEEDRTLRDEDE